jgi:hypothetical protein
MDHEEARKKHAGGKILGFFYWTSDGVVLLHRSVILLHVSFSLDRTDTPVVLSSHGYFERGLSRIFDLRDFLQTWKMGTPHTKSIH